MKREISVFDYAGDIMKRLPSGGALLTAGADGFVNPMTIGWGTLGIEWGKPVFIAFVRENRYTRELLKKNPEFTVNVPVDDSCKQILGFCGTKSGRDVDKVKELSLTLEESQHISVPGIKELPLTLECRVIYEQKQDLEAIEAESRRKYYPQDVDSSFSGSNKDCHIAFYGEIVGAYMIE